MTVAVVVTIVGCGGGGRSGSRGSRRSSSSGSGEGSDNVRIMGVVMSVAAPVEGVVVVTIYWYVVVH